MIVLSHFCEYGFRAKDRDGNVSPAFNIKDSHCYIPVRICKIHLVNTFLTVRKAGRYTSVRGCVNFARNIVFVPPKNDGNLEKAFTKKWRNGKILLP